MPGPTLYVFSLLQYWTTEKVEKLENKYVKFFMRGNFADLRIPTPIARVVSGMSESLLDWSKQSNFQNSKSIECYFFT